MDRKRRLSSLALFFVSASLFREAHAGILSLLVNALKSAKVVKGATVAAGAGAGFTAEELATDAAVNAAKAAKTVEAEQETVNLRKALNAYQAHDDAKIRQGDDAGLSVKSNLDNGNYAHALPTGRLRLLETVSTAIGKLPKVVFCSASAKKFGKEFLKGSKSATEQLQGLRRRSPALVEPWLKTPMEKRVFIIGASQSSQEIALLKIALEKDGFKLFFYKFCEPYLTNLCSPQEVGAFFSTSGHVISVKSPAASASSYIPVEIATANSVIAGGYIIVFTPDDVAKLATASSVTLSAETFEFEESDVKRARTT